MSTDHDSEPYLREAEQRLTVTEVGLRRDAVRVAVTGELDIGTAAALHQRLSEILDRHPGQRLELDLSALDFCDVAGLRALDDFDQTSAQARCQVRIAAAGYCFDLLLKLCATPTVLGYTPIRAYRDAEGF